jgi:hypothetical protein
MLPLERRIMKVILLFPAVLAAFAICPVARAEDTSTIRREIASRSFLLGTWHCTFTVGNEGGNYATTWARVLDGLWLEQTYDQPKQPRAFPFRGDYLIGYDQRRGQWVRFGAMTTGQYFAIRMTDTGEGNWGWKYVSLFPRKRLETAGYDAIFTRKNDVRYVIDGPTYPNDRGTMVTEHHMCTKG